MPLPFILGGVAIATGILGAVGHAVAKETNEEADTIITCAEYKQEECLEKFQMKREEITLLLEEYGEMKLNISCDILGAYVEITNQLNSNKKIEIQQTLNAENYQLDRSDIISADDYLRIKEVSAKSQNLVSEGIESLGRMGLLNIGMFNGVTLLISTVADVGLVSGGSLITGAGLLGGASFVGGAALLGSTALGGVAAGPLMFASSVVSGVKAEGYLEDAKIFEKKVNANIALVEKSILLLETIELRVEEACRVLLKFVECLVDKMPDYAMIVDRVKLGLIDVSRISKRDVEIILLVELLVKKILEVLNKPLLDERGELKKEFDLTVLEEKVDKMLVLV